MPQKDAERNANSADLDQTAPPGAVGGESNLGLHSLSILICLKTKENYGRLDCYKKTLHF